MKEFMDFLTREQKKYEKLRNKLVESLKDTIDGFLITAAHGNYVQHYWCKKDPTTGNIKRKYIKKKDIHIAKRLAQQSYEKKVLKVVEENLKSLNYFIKNFPEEEELDDVYDQFEPPKRAIIKPVKPTLKQKINRWKSKSYIGKGFKSDLPVFITKLGEKVRSKSEKILADMFADLHIDYKYECPIVLNSGRVVYPDFTFYNPITNQEIYWEHFGMMDNPQYSEITLRKIASYIDNDIVPWKNLIFTFESSSMPLSTTYIATLISDFLI